MKKLFWRSLIVSILVLAAVTPAHAVEAWEGQLLVGHSAEGLFTEGTIFDLTLNPVDYADALFPPSQPKLIKIKLRDIGFTHDNPLEHMSVVAGSQRLAASEFFELRKIYSEGSGEDFYGYVTELVVKKELPEYYSLRIAGAYGPLRQDNAKAVLELYDEEVFYDEILRFEGSLDIPPVPAQAAKLRSLGDGRYTISWESGYDYGYDSYRVTLAKQSYNAQQQCEFTEAYDYIYQDDEVSEAMITASLDELERYILEIEPVLENGQKVVSNDGDTYAACNKRYIFEPINYEGYVRSLSPISPWNEYVAATEVKPEGFDEYFFEVTDYYGDSSAFPSPGQEYVGRAELEQLEQRLTVVGQDVERQGQQLNFLERILQRIVSFLGI